MESDSIAERSKGVRYESRKKIFNLPIVCIALGPNPERTENRGLARGFIAIGDISVGVISFGGLAFGVFSFGGASVGLASVGGLAIGTPLWEAQLLAYSLPSEEWQSDTTLLGH